MERLLKQILCELKNRPVSLDTFDLEVAIRRYLLLTSISHHQQTALREHVTELDKIIPPQ
jgi:uncharacterized protein